MSDEASQLLKAIDAKWMGMVSKTVRLVDVNTQLTADGETGAHVCIRLQGERDDQYYVPVLRLLLRLGANPNLRTKVGATPAHVAASYNLASVLDLLSEFGAEVDTEDSEGFAPAHIAAACGKTEALEWLLTKGGVAVERHHSNGMSLAMFAATAGHLDTLKCLKRLGANLRKKCHIEHELIRAQRVEASIMAMALYEGREQVAAWLQSDCDIGLHESDITVLSDPEAEAERMKNEAFLWGDVEEDPVDLEGVAETKHDDDAPVVHDDAPDDATAPPEDAVVCHPDLPVLPEEFHEPSSPPPPAPKDETAYNSTPTISRVDYVPRDDDLDSLDDVAEEDDEDGVDHLPGDSPRRHKRIVTFSSPDPLLHLPTTVAPVEAADGAGLDSSSSGRAAVPALAAAPPSHGTGRRQIPPSLFDPPAPSSS